MTLVYILLSFSILISVVGIVLTSIGLVSKDENEDAVLTDNTEKIKILLTKDAIDNIDNMIDDIIKRAADRYMILNINFKDLPYVTEKDADELTKYIFGSLKMDMTDTVRETIGILHNVSTEKQLDDFLKLRIKMYVLAIVVKTNQTINE